MTIDAVVTDETIVADFFAKGAGQISVSCTRGAIAQVANIWLFEFNRPTNPLQFVTESSHTFTGLDVNQSYMIVATDPDDADNDAYISTRISPTAAPTPTSVSVDFESIGSGGGGGGGGGSGDALLPVDVL